MSDFYIILTGSLVAVSGALLGSFLLLRKMTMVGDAISHAVLPGIVLAYLVTASRASTFMLIGAAVFGMLATVMIEVLHKRARLQEDASIGISFTWLFAIGVILVSQFGSQVDLDQDCVLYGEIALVPLRTYNSLGLPGGLGMVPDTIWLLLGLLVVVLGFVLWAYKPLLLTSFDGLYAATLGVSVAFWHYALMALVSMTTVLSFESVGAILVIAFLVGPAATAYLLTSHLPTMIGLAVGIGIVASILGYYLAVWIDGSIAGAMTAVIGGLFLLALIIQKGLLPRFRPQPVPGLFAEE